MTEQSFKNQLLTVIQQGRQAERDLVASLTDDARNTQGTSDAWGAKDVIAHIASTRMELSDNLASERVGRGGVDYHTDYQAQNDRIFQQFQSASWDEVNAYADHSVATLIAEIERYDEDELRAPQSYTWMAKGATITSELLGALLSHAYQHLSEVYLEHGDQTAALALHETILPLYESLNPTPRMLGTARYNLACTYALTGHTGQAMSLLPQAFELRPDLMEWAKTDTDLESLHTHADFHALLSQANA